MSRTPKTTHKACRWPAGIGRIARERDPELSAAGHDVVLLCRAERDASSEGVHIKPLSLPRNRAARMTAGAWRALAAARRRLAEVGAPGLADRRCPAVSDSRVGALPAIAGRAQ